MGPTPSSLNKFHALYDFELPLNFLSTRIYKGQQPCQIRGKGGIGLMKKKAGKLLNSLILYFKKSCLYENFFYLNLNKHTKEFIYYSMIITTLMFSRIVQPLL